MAYQPASAHCGSCWAHVLKGASLDEGKRGGTHAVKLHTVGGHVLLALRIGVPDHGASTAMHPDMMRAPFVIGMYGRLSVRDSVTGQGTQRSGCPFGCCTVLG